MMRNKIVFSILALLFFPVFTSGAAEYIQVAGLIDTRTTHSDGALSMAGLSDLARSRGFDVLFLNDHDRLAMAYGLPPFPNAVRLRKDLNSINISGADAFIEAVHSTRKKYKDLILIPGSESVPYYYWSGSYFKKNLTAHDHEKRILTVGLEEAADYENLPIIHNGFSTRFFRAAMPKILFFLAALFVGFYLLTEKGMMRAAAVFIIIFALLGALNTLPLRSSPYTPYMGNQGIAPYQLYIDYVDQKGGMTFWNYPETRSGVRPYGPIHLDTPPYPEVLEEARRYTGFAAIYGDTITITEPGHEWDRALLDYCQGRRARPVWGIATADYHKEGGSSEKLGNFPTVFFVKEKTRSEVLSAMRAGRMYAVRGPYPQRLLLNKFSVCAADCETPAVSGQELKARQTVKIQIALAAKEPGVKKATIRLIRSGKLIQTFQAELPAIVEYKDKDLKPGEKVFYRMDARAGGAGYLVSNPIFVTVL